MRTALEDLRIQLIDKMRGSFSALLGALLEDLEPPEAKRLLREVACRDPEPRLRFYAHQALKYFPREAVPPKSSLSKALLEGSEACLEDALEKVLSNPAPEASRWILEALPRPDLSAWIQGKLVHALGILGGPGAPEEICAYLDDPSPWIAAQALQALTQQEPEAAQYAAHYRIASSESRIAACAVATIAPVNPDIARQRLVEMLEDERVWMRYQALKLLPKIPLKDPGFRLRTAFFRETIDEVAAKVLQTWSHFESPDLESALAFCAESGAPYCKRLAKKHFAATKALPPSLREKAQEFAWQYQTYPRVPLEKEHQEFRRHFQAEAFEVPSRLLEPPSLPPSESSPEVAISFEEVQSQFDAGEFETAAWSLLREFPSSPNPEVSALKAELARRFAILDDAELALLLTEDLDFRSLDPELLEALALACLEGGLPRTASKYLARLSELFPREGRFPKAFLRAKHSFPPVPEALRRALAPRYRGLVLVGEGGMGRVLRGIDRLSQEIRAIKLPAPESLRNATQLERFRREMEALASLRHPNVVRVYECSTRSPPHYVMELLQGQDLEAYLLEKKRLDLEPALEILHPITSALAMLHGMGLTHRDLKPSNLFVTQEGTPKLTDFGLVFQRHSEELSQEGTILGTLNYMAPESLAGSTPTPAMDVYSFATVLFECLTGNLPFPQDGTIRRLLEEAPELRTQRPDLPEELSHFVAQCLKRVPEERPPNGSALYEALSKWRGAGAAKAAPESAQIRGP